MIVREQECQPGPAAPQLSSHPWLSCHGSVPATDPSDSLADLIPCCSSPHPLDSPGFLEHIWPSPISRGLHLLFLLPGMFFFQILSRLQIGLSFFFSQMRPSKETFTSVPNPQLFLCFLLGLLTICIYLLCIFTYISYLFFSS